MWIFTKQGFFSVVQDFRDPSVLLVRARDRADLERLAEGLRAPPEILVTAQGDYPFRVFLSRRDFASLLASLAADIDYTNFKAAVGESAGLARSGLYAKVWTLMRELGRPEGGAGESRPHSRIGAGRTFSSPLGRKGGEES